MPTVTTGNKREVPGNMPVLLWAEKVREYAADPMLAQLPWYNSIMEYLSPDELKRLRAKVLIWVEITGKWPEDISTWWEPRMARRRGDIPHTLEMVAATINDLGALVCGHCKARWSAPWPEDHRCKLCDRIMLLPEEVKNEWR